MGGEWSEISTHTKKNIFGQTHCTSYAGFPNFDLCLCLAHLSGNQGLDVLLIVETIPKIHLNLRGLRESGPRP